jgi:hypothetical protein
MEEEEHDPVHLKLAAEFEAQCRAIDFMVTLVRAALMREKTPRPQPYHQFVREAIALHRGDNLTVGPHPLSRDDARLANDVFRQAMEEFHARLQASVDEIAPTQ